LHEFFVGGRVCDFSVVRPLKEQFYA
jgi:hypothetical protein